MGASAPTAMHPIRTLSVNPALDISTSTGKVTSGHKLRCSSSRLDPGGSGVNVARVVQRLGGRTLAVFTVDGTTTGKQFRFVLQGPELSEPEWRLCLAVVADSIPVGGYVVASGSLPPGVPEDFYARVARLARLHNARCIVDTSGPTPPRAARRWPPLPRNSADGRMSSGWTPNYPPSRPRCSHPP